MITYKIHLIRTGKTAYGMEKRYTGQSDVPLCEQGADELCNLTRKCEYPRAQIVYTSPLLRCMETADILYPNTCAICLDELMDMNLGDFEGKTFDELRGNSDFAAWLGNSIENTPPGGEDLAVFTERVVGAIGNIFAGMMDEKLTNVAVITHRGVIMTLLSAIGLPKLPLHEWTVESGAGYTLLMTPQMWMRDQAAEVYGHIPVPFSDSDDSGEY